MNTRYKLFAEDGITLVELLIVTGVIAVLITGFVVLINPLQKIGQANDAKRKGDISQLQRALELYYQDNGKYPQSSGTSIQGINWGESWQPYIAKLPKDPSATKTYIYITPNSGSACANLQCYYVYANLDRGKYDPQACFPNDGKACANAEAYTVTNSCGGICNYGVSSPNTSP